MYTLTFGEAVIIAGLVVILIAVFAVMRAVRGKAEAQDTASGALVPVLPHATDEDEAVVAAIAAAVYAYLEAEAPGRSFRIASITRSYAQPVWSFAGAQQNVEPF